MSARSTIRDQIWVLLGTSSDDPAYTATILDPIIQAACDSLVEDIIQENKDYLSTTVTLSAESSTAHTYDLSGQASDFHSWQEIRHTNSEGALFRECRGEELYAAGSGYFNIRGIDSAAMLETSADSEAGVDLFMRYVAVPAEMTLDTDVPGGIPLRFHDVISLEALFVFALGDEGRRPADLRDRWLERRSQLILHVGKRGIQPSRVRHDPTSEQF